MQQEWWQQAFDSVFQTTWSPDVGNADEFLYKIGTVQLSSGEEFRPLQSGVTAIVGGNNVGKSTLLRQVRDAFFGHPSGKLYPSEPRLVASVLHSQSGGILDAARWIGERHTLVTNPHTGTHSFRRHDGQEFLPYVLEPWNQVDVAKPLLAVAVTFFGDAQGRFGQSASAPIRDSHVEGPAHPVHALQDSPLLFSELENITQEVFGAALTLDALGATVRLRVGKLDLEAPRVDNIPPEYREAMQNLPLLDHQGDGMRSLMGQLLPLISGTYKVVLLDEPEAFLHPPQAFALGKELGRISSQQDIQVVLATHDRNLLAGLLDSGADTALVQLRRNGNSNSLKTLAGESMRELWGDPAMQYTDILDSLFHRVAVLAEGDGDSRFYAAAVEAVNSRPTDLPSSEIHFTSVGGKAALAKSARALRAIGVPTIIAADLDVLSNRGDMKRIVQSLGAEWEGELEELWSKATAEFQNDGNEPRISDVHALIDPFLTEHAGQPFSRDLRRQLNLIIRTSSSPWEKVKQFGIAAFRADRGSANRLVEKLDEIGLILVKEGELEQLVPDLDIGKGAEWIAEALRQDRQSDEAVQKFAMRLVAACASQVRHLGGSRS